VLGGGAGGPRSGYRSLPNAVTVVKAKGGRARRRGLPGSE
jgi:hypothetical protein